MKLCHVNRLLTSKHSLTLSKRCYAHAISVELVNGGKGVKIKSTDETLNGKIAHELWFRERTRNEDLIFLDSNQRKFEVSELLDRDNLIEEAYIQNNKLCIEHNDGLKDAFDLDLITAELRDRFCLMVDPEASNSLGKNNSCLRLPERVLWKNFDIMKATHDHNEIVKSEKAMYDFLKDLWTYGAAIVKKVPAEVQPYENFLRSFSLVRETNWGKWFEVSVGNKSAEDQISINDAAYTNAELPLHTDGPYNLNPLKFQVLQCIKQSENGGESLLSDGLGAAVNLQNNHLDHFNILASTKVRFRFFDNFNDMFSEKPMINRNSDWDDGIDIGNLFFSGRLDITPCLDSLEQTDEFYTAKKKYINEIYKPELVCNFKLEDDDMLIFDNTRIFHGRKSFCEKIENCPKLSEEQAKYRNRMVDDLDLSQLSRYLRGCYVENVENKFRVLKRKYEPQSPKEI